MSWSEQRAVVRLLLQQHVLVAYLCLQGNLRENIQI